MVNDVACNDILHSVSIMTVSNVGKKLILFKQAGIIYCHIFVTLHLLNLIIFYGLRRPLNSFIKKYIFKYVKSLYELIFLFKIEL